MDSTLTVALFSPIQKELDAVEARLRQAVAGQHKALTVATEHLLAAGGKRIRPALVLLTAGLFPSDTEQVVSLAAAVELLHTATLVHDDLIDGAMLRRGVPTLNADWSPIATVLTGDYLFARAASLVAQTNNVHIINLFAKTLMIIVNGEVHQNFSGKWNASRKDYYERIYAKTAAMFVLATKAAAILGDADEASLDAIGTFGREIGMAFQIVDDVLDYVGTPDRIGKPVGSDLHQGLITLPAIYYLEAYPDDTDMKTLFNGGPRDRDTIPRAIAAISKSGAVDKALHEASEFMARGQRALEIFPNSTYLTALLSISHYIIDRTL